MSQWSKGTGLGGLLRNILKTQRVQESLLLLFSGAGQLIVNAINNGDTEKAKAIAQNMHESPQAFVGAAVKNTEAQQLVDPGLADAAEGFVDDDHDGVDDRAQRKT